MYQLGTKELVDNLLQTGMLIVVAPPNGFRATPQYLSKRTLLLVLQTLLEAGRRRVRFH